jgi:hypothetical protein
LLIALGLLTSWATSSIVAQTKPSKRKAAPQGAAAPQIARVPKPSPNLSDGVVTRELDLNTVINDEPNPQEKLAAFLRSGAGAEATLIRMDATANGRHVLVSQSVHLLERSANTSYVWALRVSQGPASKIQRLSEHYYVNQIFQVPAELMQVAPTFNESFELAPGVYHVEVSLHRIPARFDLTQLNDDNIKHFSKVAFGTKRIVVAD